jgi:hypothetical protein
MMGHPPTKDDEVENWDRCENEAWRDSYFISWVGASNPRAVARTLTRHRAVLGENHVAVRAIAGHLSFLQGASLGPEPEELAEVEAQAWRLGLL